ncbi:MAG: hypothetical protein P4L57_10905 [Rhizomicrobium sp.]|nr:hypothetical protein [Rhizomicrobium sp.]
MQDFHKFLMRHGESWIQDIIERIERNEGIRHTIPLCLEDRWEALMRESSIQPSQIAA